MTGDVVQYLPMLGPWRAGYRFDPTVLVVWNGQTVPCTPGGAAVLFFLLTGQYPTGQTP